MIRHIPSALFCSLSCILLSLLPAYAQKSDAQLMKEANRALKEQLLEVWYPRLIDRDKGGFYSSFTHDWQLTDNQQKMIVTQARHVWTTAKAAGFFPENKMYREAAAHGFRFLKDKMWDEEYGGFYNLVDRAGKPIGGQGYDQYKRAYGNAFAIYALAAYYALSQDKEALELAKKTFHWLEEHAYDKQYGGYFPSMTREGKAVTEDAGADIYEHIQTLFKEQNTSIHLLEAFTELYRVWPDALLEKRLQGLLQSIRDTMVTKPGYLQLYFYRDWTPVSFRDSTAAIREAHYNLDHVSFGHDIETAFLMLEASEVLHRFEWDKTMEVGKMMVDHTVAHGFDPQRSGIYEQGYYFKGKSDIAIVDKGKNWWSQAEGLNALLLFAQLYPEEKQYRQQFEELWKYVQQYMIDEKHGGWYAYGLDTEPEARHGLKAHIWKSPYHNGRSLMNIVRMLQGENILH